MNSQTLSCVVPVYNESACVQLLYEKLAKVLETLGMQLEFIFVDDHSNDATLEILKKIRQADARAKIISFSRNFGHQVAVVAGLHHASGDCVVVMDGDLQDPPEIIHQMVEKWRQGYEVVYGIRRQRQDSLCKALACKIFYRVLERIAFSKMPLDAGDFCLLSRRVVESIKQFHEENPYVRGLRSWVGFKQTGVVYDRPARAAGKSKYGFAGLFQLALSGIFSFSILPLRAATALGLVVSLVSMCYALFLFAAQILIFLGRWPQPYYIPGWATLACGLFFLMGMQFIFLGILGEYVGRTYMQSKERPLYVIEEKVGFDE